jgi:hypothetical protein
MGIKQMSISLFAAFDADVASFYAASVAVLLSVFALCQTLLQRRDVWLQEVAATHREFWGDEGLAEIRIWLWDGDGSDVLDQAIENRIQRGNLTRDECLQIDKLDHFLNLICRLIILRKKLRLLGFGTFATPLFFTFWVDEALKKKVKASSDLGTYIGENYEPIDEYLKG